MKFYTSYSPAVSLCEPKCPKEITDYLLNEATGDLEPCGTIPIYERIQSYYESTRLSTKLKRLAMGDTGALGSGVPGNSDFSGAPRDLREVLESRKKVTTDFAALPDNVRAVFNNSFEEFEKAVNNGTAERRLFTALAKPGTEPGTESGTEPGTESGTEPGTGAN